MKRMTLAFCALLAACSGSGSGGGSLAPAVGSTDVVKTSRLQFAVGTATYYDSTGTSQIGLNMVETLRQPNGLSATLFNVPVVTGPPTFVVPATFGTDGGTNRMTQQGVFASGQGTGAFGYGFCACNSLSIDANTSSGGATPAPTTVGAPALFVPLGNPIGTSTSFYGGAPAFPTTLTPAYDAAFTGYSLGFNFLPATPVRGSYTLAIGIPPTFGTAVGASTPTIGATANLSNAAGLAAYPTPVFVPDDLGGGTFSITPPAGVTETMIEVNVTSTCLGYTVPSTAPVLPGQSPPPAGSNVSYTLLAHGSAPARIPLPDTIGPAVDGVATPTMCSQRASYTYSALGFDYPAFEASYPANRTQAPTIVGTNGQADVTVSQAASGTYP